MSVNPAGLQPGQAYVSGIQLTPISTGVGVGGFPQYPGGGKLTIPVVLYYGTASALSASPATLTFNYQAAGSNNVTQQTIAVNPPGTSFIATPSVSGSPQWLGVSPSSGTGISPSPYRRAASAPGRIRVPGVISSGSQLHHGSGYVKCKYAAAVDTQHHGAELYLPARRTQPARSDDRSNHYYPRRILHRLCHQPGELAIGERLESGYTQCRYRQRQPGRACHRHLHGDNHRECHRRF